MAKKVDWLSRWFGSNNNDATAEETEPLLASSSGPEEADDDTANVPSPHPIGKSSIRSRERE